MVDRLGAEQLNLQGVGLGVKALQSAVTVTFAPPYQNQKGPYSCIVYTKYILLRYMDPLGNDYRK